MSRAVLLRKLRRFVAALPALAFGFVASPAFSAIITINASGVSAGANSASFLGATMTSAGGNFTKVTSVGTNPREVIGVSTGFVANEIDVDAESITINFGTTGAVVNEVILGLLFLEGEWGGAFDEAARIQTNGGTTCNTGFCILSASGVWNGSTVGVTTLSSGVEGNGGIFRITNPFGSTLLNSATFLPWSMGGPPPPQNGTNSDFGIVSVTYTTTIPEPGTLVLVGLGSLALALRGRRRARA